MHDLNSKWNLTLSDCRNNHDFENIKMAVSYVEEGNLMICSNFLKISFEKSKVLVNSLYNAIHANRSFEEKRTPL